MALTKKLPKDHDFNQFGYTFDNSYIKIDGLDIDAIEQKCDIHVGVFINEEARRTEKSHRLFKKSYHQIPFDDLKITDITKAQECVYNWLKKQEEWGGCKDC